jgi:hypothetical protein
VSGGPGGRPYRGICAYGARCIHTHARTRTRTHSFNSHPSGIRPSRLAPDPKAAPPPITGPALDPLVRRFRRLREALTSLGAATGGSGAAPRAGWAAAAYELSADVAAAAGNTAELLKALQALANTVYPAAEAEAVVEGAAAGAAGGAGGGAAGPPRAPAAPAALSRRAEVHAALLVWFLCVPARPVHAEVAKRLRATPPELLATREVRAALAAASALMRGNWRRLAAAAEAAPPLVARVLEAGAPAARARAARAMAVAYRSLPLAAFCDALGAAGGGREAGIEAARAALEAARGALGSKGAAVALERLGGGGGGDLAFR